MTMFWPKTFRCMSTADRLDSSVDNRCGACVLTLKAATISARSRPTVFCFRDLQPGRPVCVCVCVSSYAKGVYTSMHARMCVCVHACVQAQPVKCTDGICCARAAQCAS